MSTAPKAALIDIAGVLTDGASAIAGAVEAMAALRESGVPFRLLTNTTSKPKRRVLETLAEAGFEIGAEEVFAPAEVAVAVLRERGLTPHLLIRPDLEEDFADCPKTGRKAVVIGDAGDRFDYVRLNAAFRALMDGAAFLALAENRTFRDDDGDLSLDAGAFVHALAYSSGETPEVLGKPARSFFQAAADSMDCALAETVMIGDDAEADVAGALKAGVGAAYLVRTGKYRDGDEMRFDPPPTTTVSDLAEALSHAFG